MSAADIAAWAHQNQIALAVFAPLIGAALAAAAPGRTIAWTLALAAAFVAAFAALSAAADALAFGRGGGLHRDGAAAFAAPLLALNMLTALLGAGALLRDINPRAAPFAAALALLVGGGWTGALFADRLVEMFLSIQVSAIAAIALTALAGERERGALNGALRMYSACGVAAALMLLGVGLLERGAGIASLSELPLAQIASPDMALLGAALLLVSIAWTAGLAPLNNWSGVAFARGGRLAALLIGAVHTVGAAAVLVRIASFALQAPAIGVGVASALAALGAAALAVGSVQAIGSSAVSRLAAHCVSAQAGGVLIAAALGSSVGYSAAFLQLTALTGVAAALFCAAAIAPRDGEGLNALDGLVRRAPLASLAFGAAALSAMGAPLTIGFLARWRLMEAGIGAGWWWTVAAAVAASLAGVFYGGKLIDRVFLRRSAHAAMERPDRWRLLLVPGALAGVALICVGLAPQSVLASAATAADIVMRSAP